MTKKSIKAIDAIEEAQRIAFAPFVFQAVIALRKLGIFDFVFKHRKKGGVSIEDISNELGISEYGIGVLLEIAESSNIIQQNEAGNFELTTIGYYLNYHEIVNVNINFTNEICYKGLFHLDEAIASGKPSGLKELGDWSTIYEGLSKLEPHQQKAWFEFDHFYSDEIFSDALNLLFEKDRKYIFDIGANTGKFTINCCKFDENVKVKMVDLPGQLKIALKNVEKEGIQDRVSSHGIDWLSENPQLPSGADTYWLSQFLDCFSLEEIEKILRTCANSMDENSELIIIETYTDRQRFDNTKFILEATSLYFTALANGNSKMYKADEILYVAKNAGLTIKEDRALGEYHTMFTFSKS